MVIYLLPDAHGKLEPAVERLAAAAMTLWQQGLLFKAMTGSFLLHTFVSFYFLAGTVLKMLRVASVERRKEVRKRSQRIGMRAGSERRTSSGVTSRCEDTSPAEAESHTEKCVWRNNPPCRNSLLKEKVRKELWGRGYIVAKQRAAQRAGAQGNRNPGRSWLSIPKAQLHAYQSVPTCLKIWLRPIRSPNQELSAVQ